MGECALAQQTHSHSHSHTQTHTHTLLMPCKVKLTSSCFPRKSPAFPLMTTKMHFPQAQPFSGLFRPKEEQARMPPAPWEAGHTQETRWGWAGCFRGAVEHKGPPPGQGPTPRTQTARAGASEPESCAPGSPWGIRWVSVAVRTWLS